MWFWQKWKTSYQFLYLFSVISLLICIGWSLYSFERGHHNIIMWEKKGNIEAVKTPLPSFKYQFFEFQPDTDSFLITEQFVASTFRIDELTPYLSLYFYILGMIVLLTVISDLQKIGYAIGMAVFTLGLSTLGTEILGIFHQIDQRSFLMMAILAYGLPSYYFASFRYGTPYLTRFAVYLLITIVLAVIIKLYTTHSYPFQHLAYYNVAIPIIVNLVFQALTAHEILRGVLYVLTAHNNIASRHTWQHLVLIGLFYFANLIYCYVYFTGQWNVQIGYLHPFILQGICTILGIWGFRHRQPQYESYFPFVPTGAFLYVALGLIAFSGLGYALATDNTPLIEVYEDTALYTQIGFGIGFLGYVVINFKKSLLANQPVYWYLWKPLQMSYGYGFAFGVFLITMALLYQGFLPYNQAIAGYFNSLGDEEYRQGNLRTAEEYYRTALGYDSRNHRSYYALGSIALLKNDKNMALVYFRDANLKKPSAFAYSQIAEILAQQNRWLEAIFILKEGAERCSEKGELYNNIALLYNKTEVPDSTHKYFELAAKYVDSPQVVESNSFALWTKYEIRGNIDTSYINTSSSEYVVKAGNELVLFNKYGRMAHSFEKKLLSDSTLTTAQLCYLYNYALNPKSLSDTSLTRLLAFYASLPGNSEHQIFLDFARAHLLFHQGDAMSAFPLMERVTEGGGTGNIIYPIIYASWLLQHRQFEHAKYYFDQAYQRGDKEAQNFVTLTERESLKSDETLWWKRQNGNELVEKALVLSTENRWAEAIGYLEKALRHFPYREEIYIALANAYFQVKNNPMRYETLLTALKWLPQSSEILKNYIHACLELNYTNFAEYALEDLKKVTATDEFERFRQEYNAKLTRLSVW